MGDVAASGGYWISMNANRIFAEPNTITGSIGIFGMYYSVPDTLAKLGVQSDGVGTGPMAGAFDITRPLDPKVGAVIQAIIDKGYRDFVGNVAKARGKSYDAIDAIAQGRVWTGQQALDRGLVDQLGGLRCRGGRCRQHGQAGQGLSGALRGGAAGRLRAASWSGSTRAPACTCCSPGACACRPGSPSCRRMAPELELLRHAKAGTPNIYADCLCSPH